MKKRAKVIALVILIVITLIPVHVQMSDGGSEGWHAILWQYTRYFEMTGDGWRIGPRVTLLGAIPIYDGTGIVESVTEIP